MSTDRDILWYLRTSEMKQADWFICQQCNHIYLYSSSASLCHHAMNNWDVLSRLLCEYSEISDFKIKGWKWCCFLFWRYIYDERLMVSNCGDACIAFLLTDFITKSHKSVDLLLIWINSIRKAVRKCERCKHLDKQLSVLSWQQFAVIPDCFLALSSCLSTSRGVTAPRQECVWYITLNIMARCWFHTLIIKYGIGYHVILQDLYPLKEALCNIYNISEVIIQTHKYLFFHMWINKLFSEGNKVPDHCLKLKGWQGPPHMNKEKTRESLLSFVSSSYSVMKSKRVYFCRRKDLSLLIKVSSPKLRSDP